MTSRRQLQKELEQIEKQLLEIEVTDKSQEEYELQNLLEEQSYYAAYDNSYNFLMNAWNTFETVEFRQGKHLHAIAEHLDACVNGQIKNLIINIQPRNSKTCLVSKAFPAYLWIKRPRSKIINLSYSFDLSVKDSVASRSIIASEWYQRGLNTVWRDLNNWDYIWELSKDNNQKYDYENTLGGRRYATSVLGTVYGAGADFILCDDPMKASEAHSKVIRDKTNEALSQIFSTRLNDRNTGCRILIAQRLHGEDSTNYFLEQGNWEHLCIPTEWDETQRYWTNIGWTDWRSRDKELMNPERFDRNAIEEMKVELGEYAYAAQCQQRPVPLGGGLIKDSWWNIWYVLPAYFDSAVIAMDLNTKEGVDNDNTAIIVMGRKDSKLYVIDLVYGNMDIVKQLEAITNICNKYPFIRRRLIEDKSNGSAVWSLLQRNITGLTPVDPKGIGKEVRIMSMIPEINAGNVHLPDREACGWIKPLLTEASMFPKGKHDDALDAMQYAIEYLVSSNSFTKMPEEIITEGHGAATRQEIRDEVVGTYYNESINTSRNYIRGLFN